MLVDFLCCKNVVYLYKENEIDANECKIMYVIKILLISVIPENDLKQNIYKMSDGFTQNYQDEVTEGKRLKSETIFTIIDLLSPP